MNYRKLSKAHKRRRRNYPIRLPAFLRCKTSLCPLEVCEILSLPRSLPHITPKRVETRCFENWTCDANSVLCTERIKYSRVRTFYIASEIAMLYSVKRKELAV